VRGTRDFAAGDCRLRRHVEQAARRTAEGYGYDEVATPVFEFTEVFARTLGDTTDIVTKEMYTFADRSGESLTLRPENTAGIVRAFITGGLGTALPIRAYYQGPMFRYERPQKGRLRQFHQVGVELLGIADPGGDVEVIALAADFLAALGLGDTVRLEINSLGDGESRAAYRETLLAYLSAHREALSEDSRARLERNPLRILDSKDEGDREIVAGAPLLADCLNDISRAFFDQVLDGLAGCGVACHVNGRLVRGLDYYCHTTFEFTTTELGAQGTVLAGGRYDGLVAQMGGPATPGTGWAAGVERLMLLAGAIDPPPRPVAMLPLGAAQLAPAQALARQLRQAGLVVKTAFGNNMKKQMKAANQMQARFAVIIGSEELARGVAAVRDMDAGSQSEVAMHDLADTLAAGA
jgi:histidyl-tRNA synthetase